VGWSAGFQYHDKLVDLGVSYKSSIKHTLKGHLILSGIGDGIADTMINQHIEGATAFFKTPWQVDVGVRVRATDKLTVEGQIVRFGWSRFNAIQLANLGAALGDSQAIPENYRNTWSYSVGADYQLTSKWAVRGGIQRDLSPVTKGNRDPRVPDANRWNSALGASYALSSRIPLDAAASYDKIKSVAIDKVEAVYLGTIIQTPITGPANTDGTPTGAPLGYLHNASALVFGLGGRLSFW
jgi:long-chain fatty acid transport protein